MCRQRKEKWTNVTRRKTMYSSVTDVIEVLKLKRNTMNIQHSMRRSLSCQCVCVCILIIVMIIMIAKSNQLTTCLLDCHCRCHVVPMFYSTCVIASPMVWIGKSKAYNCACAADALLSQNRTHFTDF